MTQQQTVGGDLGNLSRAESNDEQPAAPIQQPNRLFGDLASDWVNDHVDTATAAQNFDLVTPSVGAIIDCLICTVGASEGTFSGSSCRGDDAGAQMFCDFYCRESNATSGGK